MGRGLATARVTATLTRRSRAGRAASVNGLKRLARAVPAFALTTDAHPVRFRQYTSAGSITMQVEESTPPSRFVTRIADPDQPFGGTWTFELVGNTASKTLVTITERGEVYDPLFRFMSKFVFGHTSTMDSCLAAPTTKFGA